MSKKELAGILLAWLIVILLLSTAQYAEQLKAGRPLPFIRVFNFNLTAFSLYIVLSFFLAKTFFSWPAQKFTPGNVFILYILMICIFVPIQACYIEYMFIWFFRKTAAPPLSEIIKQVNPFGWWLLSFKASVAFVVHLGFSLLRLNRQRALHTQELKSKNLLMRLSLLQGQLEPYFLLSSLDGIGHLIRNAERNLAITGLVRLSDLLRHVLRVNKDKWPSMCEEIVFAKAYLNLLQLSCQHMLQVQWQQDEADWNSPVCPPMLLHAVIAIILPASDYARKKPQQLQIMLALRGHNIEFTTSLTGPDHDLEGFHEKLASTRERLAALYGTAAQLDLHQGEQQWELALRFPAEDEHYG